jgi:rubrerythrin
VALSLSEIIAGGAIQGLNVCIPLVDGVDMAREPRIPVLRPTWTRRRLIQSLVTWGCLPWLPSARSADYPATIAAMHRARATETSVYHHYLEFSQCAQREGYRGVAYLFAAFAASEQVHAANFGKILARLNVALAPLPKPAIRVGSTRANLMRAADDEMASIESFYPKLLEQIEPEGHEGAITQVHYAWASEKQHRARIQQIQRWTGVAFEKVARSIDEKTGRYFVCQNCGSTLNAVPADQCPVCKFPPQHYRAIEPPA